MTNIKLDSALIAVTKPVSSQKSIVAGEGFRITVLTPMLFRVETSKTNKFIDEATQIVWFRNLATPSFKTQDEANLLKIKTDAVTLVFNKSSKRAVHIIFKDGKIVKCNNAKNLNGTQRTLDMNFGIPHLGNGIMSKSGVAVVNDNSLFLNVDGEVVARNRDTVDNYIFAYGKEFRLCLTDFYRITGGVPLIPRFALGNWWSRYRAYTQAEYTTLMQRFIDEDIPISVATIDMDWHWVNLNNKFGTAYPKDRGVMPEGWTGYSWNTDLFPDYKGFLKWLNEQNLKVTMNLHPASGIRSFEDIYEPMAREMNIDPITKTDIPFDFTNNQFINAYFKIAHKPYENDGVCFWWIDWQQGKNTKLKGLDPLWALNHYHTLDNARQHRPLILSRYAGVGSHRYPLGFSGDTFINWGSLKLQPYFTNNASNVGYTWWSHDIGGHQFGHRSDEMYLRWLQYGVFSPINRMHSTSNDLLGKEPWAYRGDINHYLTEFLRLRHRLIPYIYTMNYLTYSEGRALCEPMYYSYPNENDAYNVKNQYMFGTELMVCPITSKIDNVTGMSGVNSWLPKGRWTDIFTGQVYNGGKKICLYRDETSIPVLAREGAIIPLANNVGNDSGNPKNVELWVYRGEGNFTLYEDDGFDNNYDTVWAKTKMCISEKDNVTFTLNPTEGNLTVIPSERNYKICFKDVTSGQVKVLVNDTIVCDKFYDKKLNIDLNNIKTTDKVIVLINDYTIKTNISHRDAICQVVAKCQGDNLFKMIAYGKLKRSYKAGNYKRAVKHSCISNKAKKIIYEYLDS
ncbi:MAG: glycoside hydrolase family 31 protein [Clostridia bacterium]